MAALENQFKKRMDNSEKITIAIEKLPVKYQPLLNVEMRKEGTMLMAQHIENDTFQHWQSVHGLYANNTVIDGPNKEEKDKGKELALAVFSGTCNRCGCQGHKETKCYAKKHMNRQMLTLKNNSGGMGSNNDQNSKNNFKKKRYQGNCNYCSKFGHKEADCRNRAADAKNRNQETAATAISDGNCVEVQKTKLVVWQWEQQPTKFFPDSHKLLMQTYIWIGDTVAMMDMMPHDISMVNRHAAKESVSIVMGNKLVEKSIAIGDIHNQFWCRV